MPEILSNPFSKPAQPLGQEFTTLIKKLDSDTAAPNHEHATHCKDILEDYSGQIVRTAHPIIFNV